MDSVTLSWVQVAVGWFAGTLVAVALGAWAARYSSRDLRREANNLADLSSIILAALQKAGIAEVKWDEKSGRPLGVYLHKSKDMEHVGRGGSVDIYVRDGYLEETDSEASDDPSKA
jgi:hypothetical protein